MTKEKFFGLLGWVGMVTSVLMYVFYFPQIQQNLAGNKGSFIQPFTVHFGLDTVCLKKIVTGLL